MKVKSRMLRLCIFLRMLNLACDESKITKNLGRMMMAMMMPRFCSSMGDGRWLMGDERWTMGDGRWVMGDGRSAKITGKPQETIGNHRKPSRILKTIR